MTTEALRADLSHRPSYVAVPPQECLNGCESRTGDATAPVACEPEQRLCPACRKRLDKWLRAIPDAYALLPHVVDHGTVPADPGTKHTKRPDPPAPMRAEVTDLLDTRPGLQYDDDGTPIVSDNLRGVLGVVHSWAELVRDHRHDTRPCTCGHARPSHTDHRCSAIGCPCREYTAVDATVSRECAYLIVNLAWATGQEFAGDLYEEIRVLSRTLNDTVGEYRPKPVGKCAALRDVPGSWENGSTEQVLCGGALVMDREGTGVHCLQCGARHEANHELRALGLLVDRIFHGQHYPKEAS
jgi:hypothetical protein